MIKPLPWHMLPATPVIEALPQFLWLRRDGDSPAADAAALMLYVALNFAVEGDLEKVDPAIPLDERLTARARLSYDQMQDATGLSRALVVQGLARLTERDLIRAEGTSQDRSYRIPWPAYRFFKLPCRAIVRDGVIRPFEGFHLRSKFDLYALKLYLYLASIRSNTAQFSMAAYETIHRGTGIPERDIKRAISQLIGCRLLAGVDREYKRIERTNEPNKYHLQGCADLFAGRGHIRQNVATPLP